MQRILHTMLRVGDMHRAVNFYTRVLDMTLLRTFEPPDKQYRLSFVGYGDETSSCVIELTENLGISSYTPGSGFGHIAIAVNDCDVACAEIRQRGGHISYEPTPLQGSDEIIAFIVDPDGYSIELIQRTK